MDGFYILLMWVLYNAMHIRIEGCFNLLLHMQEQNELKELTQHIKTAILTGNNPNSAGSQMK